MLRRPSTWPWMWRVASTVLGLGVAGVPWVGCGTSARGVGACREVEQARCRRAAAVCPALALEGDPGLEACLSASRDRCLHGMALSADPPAATVTACVHAIEQAGCSAVAVPDHLSECAALFGLATQTVDASTPDSSEPDGPADSGS